jgi:hypothetical protein
MENSLTVFNQKEIEESQKMAGQTSFTRMPFVPIVTPNNKKVKKLATIDGIEQEVEVPAKKGFLMLEKNEDSGQMEEKFLDGNITGVILKERFMIEKKYVKGEDIFRSDEFESWNEDLDLYEKGNRKNLIFQGKYSEIRDAYTSIDDKGKQTKAYDLYVILYVNLEMTGTIVRVKLRMTSDNNWFDYKNEFGKDEPWAGYVTHFNLIEKTVGKNTYWHILLERGQAINLSEQLILQKELNKYFQAIKPSVKLDVVRTLAGEPVFDETSQPFHEDEILQITDFQDQEEKEEVNIDDIPF